MKTSLAPLKLPPAVRTTLDNGLMVMAAERGPLPLVAIRLMVRAGSAVDPPAKHGLSDFTAGLLRRGADDLSADAINEAVEYVGASLGVGSTQDFLILRIVTPAEHVPEMLEVLAKLVRAPRFVPQEVDAARERTVAQLAHAMDDPSSLADRAILQAGWGGHPYGHDVSGSASAVEGFTREDVERFHRERVGPRVSLLVAVGALNPETFAVQARRAFGSWTGGPADPATALSPPPPPQSTEPRWVVVDKPDQSQTQVRIGSQAFAKGHPDFMATYMANMVLGGGFTSRLMDQIRVNRGLSYGVSSSILTLQAGGWFEISTFTKTATTRALLEVALAEVEKIRTRGISARELAQSQTYVCGLFPLRLETNEAIASSLAELELYGLGSDWVERYRERICAVTPSQAKAAAQKYFLQPAPTVVLLGQGAEIESQLAAMGQGPVERWKPKDLR